MNASNKVYLIVIGAIVALIVLAVGGWFAYQKWHGGSINDQGTTLNVSGGFTVNAKTQPDLNRKLTFPKDFPGDAKKIITDNVATLVENLKKNPADYSSWLDLAIQYKTIADYEGARLVWEYVNTAAPTQSISFHNLGNLYDLYLKNYPKSEENYLTAIKNGPNQTSSYLGMHELYRYSYKQNTSAAVDILLQGMKAIPAPGNVDLTIMLASYYKDKHDIANAKKYYQQALAVVRGLGNNAMVTQLTAEISALK